jgi:hypothetical protein
MRIKLLCLLSILFVTKTEAQMTGRGDIFLKGHYLEIGIATNGSLGSGDSSPAGYHPFDCGTSANRIAVVADPDKDGWTKGIPIRVGDYILPGTPAEGWQIQTGDSLVAAALRVSGDSSYTAGLDGHNIRQYFVGKESIGLWQGSYAGLEIQQQTQVNEDKMHILFTVTIKNTSSQTIRDIYYNRMVDADNEHCYGARFDTRNKIESQLPNPTKHVSVSASGDTYNSYFGLHTKDCRAKAYIMTGMLFSFYQLDTLYNGTGGAVDFVYTPLDSVLSDAGMGIVFKLDSLTAGESTILSYTYIFDRAEAMDLLSTSAVPVWQYKDSAFHTNDTILACEGAVIDINLFAPGPGNWIWDTSVYLETLSGSTNRITVRDTNTYRAIRVSCGEPDTMYITVCAVITEKPVLSLSGTLISVTPATYTSYQWYKDDMLEPGATSVPYRVSVPGKYYVQVTDAYGCTSNSDTIDVSILSVDDIDLAQTISIFPNPAESIVNIRAAIPVNAMLTDLSGKVLLQVGNARELDLSPFAEGLYLLRISDQNNRVIGTQKLLKQRQY